MRERTGVGIMDGRHFAGTHKTNLRGIMRHGPTATVATLGCRALVESLEWLQAWRSGKPCLRHACFFFPSHFELTPAKGLDLRQPLRFQPKQETFGNIWKDLEQ